MSKLPILGKRSSDMAVEIYGNRKRIQNEWINAPNEVALFITKATERWVKFSCLATHHTSTQSYIQKFVPPKSGNQLTKNWIGRHYYDYFMLTLNLLRWHCFFKCHCTLNNFWRSKMKSRFINKFDSKKTSKTKSQSNVSPICYTKTYKTKVRPR